MSLKVLLARLSLSGFVLLFLGLGIWQVKRHEWKQDLLSHLKVAQQQPPYLHLPLSPGSHDHFRRVDLQGNFLKQSFKFMNKIQEGQQGYHVIALFKTHQGQKILVDLGWLPAPQPLPTPRGKAQLRGYLRPPTMVTFWTPQNRLDQKELYRINPDELGTFLGQPLYPLYLVITEPLKILSTLPEKQLPMVQVPNNHLSYAVTWFSLSLLTLIALLRALRRA